MSDPATSIVISSVNDILQQAASVPQPDIAPPSPQSSGGPTSNLTKSSVWLGVYVLSKNKESVKREPEKVWNFVS